jgi:hypothetical protein
VGVVFSRVCAAWLRGDMRDSLATT